MPVGPGPRCPWCFDTHANCARASEHVLDVDTPAQRIRPIEEEHDERVAQAGDEGADHLPASRARNARLVYCLVKFLSRVGVSYWIWRVEIVAEPPHVTQPPVSSHIALRPIEQRAEFVTLLPHAGEFGFECFDSQAV